MSSEENHETTEAASTDEARPRAASKPKSMAPTGRGNSVASRSSDFATKPGFRDPTNKRSKATRKKRRKK
jgi:hypothetical protein